MASEPLAAVRANLNDAISKKLHSVDVASKLSSSIFFAGAAAVAGICQYTTWPSGESPSVSQVVGISATAVVFLSALVSIMTNKDATAELQAAQKALAQAEALQDRVDDAVRFWPDVEAMVALHSTISLFRDQLESACISRIGLEDLLSSMLTLVERTLPAAAGFTYSDPWTICLYKANELESEPNRFKLDLVEHLRAVKCDKKDARSWPEGKGVSGIAFSNACEIQIPDMSETAAVALYNSAGVNRDYDFQRYRSMVVVPIHVQGLERPWGVVAATSARVGHFNHEHEDGLKPIEAIRALARYAALGVALCNARSASQV